MIITKEFEFDAAHRLTFHKGKCFNVHGHRYKVQITLEGEMNQDGLLIDFSDLKFIKEWIDENWDHTYIYKQDDEVGLFLKSKGYKVFEFGEHEPTAENMSKFLYFRFNPVIKGKTINNLKISKVTVYETPTAKAEFIG